MSLDEDCCPYCGNGHDALDINHVQLRLSNTKPELLYRTRTEAQVELVANLSEVLNRDLGQNLEPLTGEISHFYLSFALEDIKSLNTALVGLYEILAEKQE